MNSDQKELHKHTVRKLKTEIYEYESELRTNPDQERQDIIFKLIKNLQDKLNEILI